MIFVDWTCDSCKHKHEILIDDWKVACDAFPDGMPKGWFNVDVTKLKECANGIKYELKEKSAEKKRAV